MQRYEVCVIGGGPAGATAAHELAQAGVRVLLVNRPGRIKPCGGAVPPRLLRDFEIPDALLVARARCARMVAPSGKQVDIAIDSGSVGMVDRGPFDEWLRERAAAAGAHRLDGRFERLQAQEEGYVIEVDGQRLWARAVIGADGARSAVAQQALPDQGPPRSVFAYHEVVQVPDEPPAGYAGQRCEVHYDGQLSPDFYGWVFPHGATASIGTGSADKGFSLRRATEELRARSGLADAITLRREGAPLPLQPLKRWDDGHGLVLAGDAAGVVAPASGEGIYYAMLGGRLAAEGVREFLREGNPRALKQARRRFMAEHGRVFWVLGVMQRFWYGSDARRERFVSICRDKDVQQLTFDAYLEKRLVRAKPFAHLRIFFKDLAHLLGLVRA